MYDLEEIKQAAAGRWAEIFQALAGVDRQILDGKHHPCPKCGGNDRFRAIDLKIGGLFCNHCFDTKNGDGIAAVMWLLDCNFKTALPKIGEYLGVKEQPKTGKGSKSDPAKDLKFTDWNPTLAGLWCLKKKPITVESLEKIGAKMAVYRGEFKVIALPIWRKKPENITGWYVMNANGGTLPGNDGQPIKGKSTKGSKSGVIGWIDGAELAYKTEGPTDLLALVSILGDGACGFTNSNGAKENPAKPELCWLPELLNGKEIRIIHDADQVGQDGATFVRDRPGWSPWLAAKCPDSIVKNILLPYEIEPTHGKDIRDWINEGGNLDGLQTLVDAAEPTEPVEEIEEEVIEAVDDPFRLARVSIVNHWTSQNKHLVYWKQTWLVWKAGCYYEIEERDIFTDLMGAIKEEFDNQWRFEMEEYKANTKSDDPPPVARKVSKGLCSNVIEATRSLVSICHDAEMGSWLSRPATDDTFLSMKNGILNLTKLLESDENTTKEEILMEHTPDWFSMSQRNFDFDPNAFCPNWVAFLEDVFNGDQEAILALQQWFGYLASEDTSLEKIMVIIGKKRSGKGTIQRVLKAMIGSQNITTPTLHEIGTQYGLKAMIGKTVAIITDARIADRADQSSITERLLSISGNDPQNIQRKYKDTLSGFKLGVRFTMFSNLVPKLKDVSSTFLTRCIFMVMPNTYYGREDYTLQPRLLKELSGIFNHSIVGIMSLRRNGIKQPNCGMPALNEMKSILSPVSVFTDECCEFGKGCTADTKYLFSEWEQWCEKNDSLPGTSQTFAKKLRATDPTLETEQYRTDTGEKRRQYKGIKISGDVKINF